MEFSAHAENAQNRTVCVREPGCERIRQLIDDGEIEQVTPDITIARNLLADAGPVR